MHDFNYNHSTRLLVASIPLVIALVLLIPLADQNAITIGASGFKLSPVKDNMPIIFSLLAFMLGYIVLIGLFFSRELREWFHVIKHRPEPGVRHISVRKKR